MIYSRELTDEEMQLLENYTADVKQWIDDAIAGKIAHCKKRLLREQIDLVIEKDLPLPASPEEVLAKVFSAPDYKNRKQLDELEDSTRVAIPMTAEEKSDDGQPA